MLSSIKVSIEDYKRREKGKNIGNGEEKNIKKVKAVEIAVKAKQVLKAIAL